jgi:hypothetical protein
MYPSCSQNMITYLLNKTALEIEIGYKQHGQIKQDIVTHCHRTDNELGTVGLSIVISLNSGQDVVIEYE